MNMLALLAAFARGPLARKSLLITLATIIQIPIVFAALNRAAGMIA